MAIAPARPRIYEGTRIPSPIPTDPPGRRRSCATTDDILQVNFGPNHPSTHGVLRLVVDLHGENVVGLRAVIGYLHTGFEKNMEQKTWWKAITYAPRDRLPLVPEQRARLRARGREAARARGPAEGRRGCACCCAS